jgi:hypothetical protein
LITPTNLSTESNNRQENQPVQPVEQDQTVKSVPIEVKWNIPAWMLRDQGPLVEVEDDDAAFEEGT